MLVIKFEKDIVNVICSEIELKVNALPTADNTIGVGEGDVVVTVYAVEIEKKLVVGPCKVKLTSNEPDVAHQAYKYK